MANVTSATSSTTPTRSALIVDRAVTGTTRLHRNCDNEEDEDGEELELVAVRRRTLVLSFSDKVDRLLSR